MISIGERTWTIDISGGGGKGSWSLCFFQGLDLDFYNCCFCLNISILYVYDENQAMKEIFFQESVYLLEFGGQYTTQLLSSSTSRLLDTKLNSLNY